MAGYDGGTTMKYRVKFECYWYNTGAADNHHYTNWEDFDTIEEAESYRDRVQKQIEIYHDNSPGWIDRKDEWENSEKYIEIENGFISGEPVIVKVYPEREEQI